jgi:hypothetical protein
MTSKKKKILDINEMTLEDEDLVLPAKYQYHANSESGSTSELESESSQSSVLSISEESNSENTDDIPDLVVEYQYDTTNFIDPNVTHCTICGKKQTNQYNLIACYSCFQDISINKTDSKKIYKLTDDELDELVHFTYVWGRRRMTKYLYFLKDIRLLAIQKKFGIINPDLPTYINCLNAILEENQKERNDKRNQINIRRQMVFERKTALDEILTERNIPINTRHEEYEKYIRNPKKPLIGTADNIEMDYLFRKERKERKDKLRQKIKPFGLDIDILDDECIEEYVDNNIISLKECVGVLKNIHADYIRRYNKLIDEFKKYELEINLSLNPKCFKKYLSLGSLFWPDVKNFLQKYGDLSIELEEYGLEIQTNIHQYHMYMKGIITMDEVVEHMVGMDFFIHKTNYENILKSSHRGRRPNRRDKEYAKQLALKDYLKSYSKKMVPKLVLNKYHKN